MKEVVKFRKSVMLFVKATLVTAVTLGFIQTWTSNYITTLFSQKGNYLVILSFILLFATFSTLYGAFHIGVQRVHEVIYSFALAIVFTNAIMYMELSLIARQLIPVLPMLRGCVYQFFVIVLGSCCANVFYFRLYKARKMIAIFSNDAEGFELIRKMSKISERFRIECGLNVERVGMEGIKRHIDKYEAVILCDMDKSKQKELFAYCYTKQKRTYLLPDITDIVLNNSFEMQISDTPVLVSRNRGLTVEQEIIKRFFDILLSLVAIVLTSPIMLGCAIAIKLDDGGPVFFRQNRITKGGKIFNIIKFRSMVVDADKDGAKKAVEDDKRITRVGKFIRACRMDELPQFFNVLRGDMSMVGPRPERIENVYEYAAKYPDFELRHRVKTGLTGYAQLYGKYNTSPADKLHMDLFYIETYSVLSDIKLLILTVKILFMKESTEGFDESANKNVRASRSVRKDERK